MIRLKAGVKLQGPKGWPLSAVWGIGLPIIDSVFVKHSFGTLFHTTITSAFDGTHKDGSLHYKGQALDFRIWNIDPMRLSVFMNDMRDALGSDFDVIFETDHLHIEFDPKG